MNWNKINIKSIIEVLRSVEENSPTLFSENSIVYSDGKEEIKITYKKLKEDSSKN